ncbi:hypothetical protein, partial [Arthrobacter sp.]|uniref:hypothetical protein n=1 Tax=Arthrobacter sp. TaxID=1667 RepID=UPI003A916EB3
PAQNQIAQGFKLCFSAPKRVGGSRLSESVLIRPDALIDEEREPSHYGDVWRNNTPCKLFDSPNDLSLILVCVGDDKRSFMRV